jgi:prepilin-type processing-associated H-X9-DG protein
MKPRILHNQIQAFTLFELVLVILVAVLISAILSSISLTEYQAVRQHKLRLECENNLKQISWGFQRWSNEHNGKFPMEIAEADGGTKESAGRGNAVPSFQILSNELKNPGFLICPADKTRVAATNFSSNFAGENISYFVGVDATTNNSWIFLSGDDDFVIDGVPVKSGLLEISTNGYSDWWKIPIDYTGSRHNQSGNIVFADGRMGHTHDGYFGGYLSQTGVATNRLAIP